MEVLWYNCPEKSVQLSLPQPSASSSSDPEYCVFQLLKICSQILHSHWVNDWWSHWQMIGNILKWCWCWVPFDRFYSARERGTKPAVWWVWMKCGEEEQALVQLTGKVWGCKFAKLEAKLVNVLQDNKTITFGVIFSTGQNYAPLFWTRSIS